MAMKPLLGSRPSTSRQPCPIRYCPPTPPLKIMLMLLTAPELLGPLVRREMTEPPGHRVTLAVLLELPVLKVPPGPRVIPELPAPARLGPQELLGPLDQLVRRVVIPLSTPTTTAQPPMPSPVMA